MEYIDAHFGGPMPTAAVQAFIALRPAFPQPFALNIDSSTAMGSAIACVRGLQENEAHWFLLSGHAVAAMLRRVWCDLCEYPRDASLSEKFMRGIALLRGLRLNQAEASADDVFNSDKTHALFQDDASESRAHTATASALSLTAEEHHWIFTSDDRLAAYARNLLCNVYTSPESDHALRRFAKAVEYMREFGAHKPSVMAPATSMVALAILPSRNSASGSLPMGRSFPRIIGNRNPKPEWPDLSIWITDDNHTLATWRNMIVAVWKGAATLERFPEEAGPLFARLRGEYGDHVVALVITEEQSAIPALPATRRALGLMRRYRHSARAAAMVVEKKGAMGDVVRSISQSMMRALMPRFATNYFAESQSAIQWVAAEMARQDYAFDEAAANAMLMFLRPGATTAPGPETAL